jgi:translation elongation factor EF-4
VRKALPGFKPAQPVVFCGLFPVDAADFEDLRAAMGKLRLNDASFSFEMETSAALGFGFRCGFLGLLHLEIIQERLEREFNLDLIATAPSVVYHSHDQGRRDRAAQSGRHAGCRKIDSIEEPWIKATILAGRISGRDPEAVPGPARHPDRADLCRQPRHGGLQLPLNEVVFDFYDRLKSITKGYASFDYQITGYEPGDLVKMQILVNERAGGCAVDARAPLAGPNAAGHVRKAQGPDPAAHVQDPDPGGHRRQGHRARNHFGAAQGRDRQVLWRRRHPQAQAAGQAEGRQEEDAPVRQGRDSAGSVYCRAMTVSVRQRRDQSVP